MSLMKRNRSIYRQLFFMALACVLASVAGCTTISIDSVRDPGFTGRIGRLFVLMRDDSQIDPHYAHNLQAAWTQRLSALGIDSRVLVISTLESEESVFGKEIKEFSPDGVLLIQPEGSMRHAGPGSHGVFKLERHGDSTIDLYWDVSLFETDPKNRIWCASITTPGGYGITKMLKMTDSILAELDHDQILTLPAAAVKRQE
jgi:hypothetical protein